MKSSHQSSIFHLAILAIGAFACSHAEERQFGESTESDAHVDAVACDLPSINEEYHKYNPFTMLPFDPREWVIDDMKVPADPTKCAELDIVACRIHRSCEGDEGAKKYQCFNSDGLLTKYFSLDITGPLPCTKEQLMDWIVAESEECSHSVGFDALPWENSAFMDLSQFKPQVCTNASRTRFRLQSIDGSVVRLTRVLEHYPCASRDIHLWQACVYSLEEKVWNKALPFTSCESWSGLGGHGTTHSDRLEVGVTASCDGKCIQARFVDEQSVPGSPGPATPYKGLAEEFVSCDVDVVPHP